MIRINLDRILAEKRKTSLQLCKEIDITPANLSVIKTGKSKAMRFSTLDAMCKALDCQPGDILEYISDETIKI